MKDDHGKGNAQAKMESIKELIAELEEAQNGNDPEQIDEVQEHIYERIYEYPLSVEVRTGWRTVHDYNDNTPEEYMLLLTTGGPACRIIGELDSYCEPETAVIQYQDWGTKWTTLWIDGDDELVLLAFVRQFYYGEGV